LAGSILNLARNIFLPSRRNAPLSEACESVWIVCWLLWLLLIVFYWSRYFRRSYDRTKLPRISEKCITRRTREHRECSLATRIAMYFQHDGPPPHYTRLVMQHLNETFHNRCIGRGSTINWLPRSPDPTPLDFCLWGWMKSKVFRRKVDT
jgi:hypothetical protein